MGSPNVNPNVNRFSIFIFILFRYSFKNAKYIFETMYFPLIAVAILFCLCMPENANCKIGCDLGFKQGTERLLSVRRNERRAKNRADVTWNPLDMLKHPDCY